MADIAAAGDTPTTLTEPQLILRAQAGDHEAFSSLVHTYGRRIYRALFYLTRNADDAADLTQETLYRAYRSLKRFDCSRPFYPWLHRIAQNLAYSYSTKKKRSTNLGDRDELIADQGKDPAANLIEEEQSNALRKAMTKLSKDHREIIVLQHFEGCSYAEMAETLDIPIGTVMSRLYSARMKLKAILIQEASR